MEWPQMSRELGCNVTYHIDRYGSHVVNVEKFGQVRTVYLRDQVRPLAFVERIYEESLLLKDQI